MKHKTSSNCFTALLLVACFCTGCDTSSSTAAPGDMAELFASIDEVNPVNDVKRSIAKDDFRFIACLGEPGVLEFPGLPASESGKILDENRYWIFPGTTDAPESDYHFTLIERAWQYSRKYNESLKEKLPKITGSEDG